MTRQRFDGPILKRLEKNDTQNVRMHCFLDFIVARETIRRKKEDLKLPRPWTKDPIFNDYHFCNVRRADDRVTKFIGRWVHDVASPKDAWFYFCIARWINQPATLDEISEVTAEHGWDQRRVLKVLERRVAEGRGVFRGSYIINSAFAPGVPKYEAVVKEVLTPLYKSPPPIAYHSIEKCWAALMERQGMGSFMAGQIVADWQTFGVISGMDARTWAPLGPGSKKGIQFVFNCRVNQKIAVEKMREALEFIEARSPEVARMHLTLHDVQNCFCEFSKYVRGYSKTKYRPHDAAQGTLAL